MPKIRKKTSNRQTTRMRAKIHKKAKETHRKARRDAKRDPTWKSKNKKDPGIPASFPYKDQLIEEAREARRVAEENRLARLGQIKKQNEAAGSGGGDDDEMEEDEDDSEGDSEIEEYVQDVVSLPQKDSGLKTYAKSLRSVVDESDVVIQVLDARDPLGTRSRPVERDVMSGHAQAKKLVFVLNKIDLVPKENVQGWLSYLRRSFPTFPMKSSTQQQRRNLGSSNQAGPSSTNQASSSTGPLMKLLKDYAHRQMPGVKSKSSLTIGVIGFPNVGKSSLINTLRRSKACGVAPTPGFTKQVQLVQLEGGLKVLDSPGVVLEDSGSDADKVLRNVVKVETVEDPISPVEVIVDKCQKEHLMMQYNIPAFNTSRDFLISAARSMGRLKKGGVPDLMGAARTILRDWNNGKIPYYTVPPKLPDAPPSKQTSLTNDASMDITDNSNSNTNAEQGDKVVTQYSKEFDIDALFAEADAACLNDLKSSKEMKAVRMTESAVTPLDENGQVKLMGETQAVDDDDDMMDDNNDAPELVEPSAGQTVSMPSRNSKKVSFVQDDSQQQQQQHSQKPSERKRQMEKMFGDEAENMEFASSNKAIKKAAKAAKKRQEKESRRTEAKQVQEQESSMDQDDNNQAYDFTQFFGAPTSANEDVDM